MDPAEISFKFAILWKAGVGLVKPARLHDRKYAQDPKIPG
jgi:hypothetical protein